jgi:hypothetical protein
VAAAEEDVLVLPGVEGAYVEGSPGGGPLLHVFDGERPHQPNATMNFREMEDEGALERIAEDLEAQLRQGAPRAPPAPAASPVVLRRSQRSKKPVERLGIASTSAPPSRRSPPLCWCCRTSPCSCKD